MLNLTREEKIVLIVLGFIFLIGAILHYTLKKNPNLWNLINFTESNRLYHHVDLNTAAYEELIRVPYIGPVTANRIIAYRKEQGPFDSVSQIKSIEGISESRYAIISKYLKISPRRPNK